MKTVMLAILALGLLAGTVEARDGCCGTGCGSRCHVARHVVLNGCDGYAWIHRPFGEYPASYGYGGFQYGYTFYGYLGAYGFPVSAYSTDNQILWLYRVNHPGCFF